MSGERDRAVEATGAAPSRQRAGQAGPGCTRVGSAANEQGKSLACRLAPIAAISVSLGWSSTEHVHFQAQLHVAPRQAGRSPPTRAADLATAQLLQLRRRTPAPPPSACARPAPPLAACTAACAAPLWPSPKRRRCRWASAPPPPPPPAWPGVSRTGAIPTLAAAAGSPTAAAGTAGLGLTVPGLAIGRRVERRAQRSVCPAPPPTARCQGSCQRWPALPAAPAG